MTGSRHSPANTIDENKVLVILCMGASKYCDYQSEMGLEKPKLLNRNTQKVPKTISQSITSNQFSL